MPGTVDQITLARVNLGAVLRALDDLPALDPVTAGLVAGPQRIIQFTAPRVATVRLALGGGEISHHRGPGPASINLLFPLPAMVNKMFAGTGQPVPVKGFRQLGYLTGPFTRITERLNHHLRPDPSLLAEPGYREANAALTLAVAAYAVAEIGNADPVGRAVASRMADGDIQVGVEDGPQFVLTVTEGRLRVSKGLTHRPRATMIFTDLATAGDVLRGDLASYTAVGRGLINLSGYVPLLDGMNKLLGLVPRYLGEEN